MLGGKDATMLASMAKLKSGRLSREIADACRQYYGGMGCMNETDISRAYRDARLGSVGGGADEIMLSTLQAHGDIAGQAQQLIAAAVASAPVTPLAIGANRGKLRKGLFTAYSCGWDAHHGRSRH